MSTGTQRKLPWVFQSKSEAGRKIMSLLLLPMEGSLAFRKLGVDENASLPQESPAEKVQAKILTGLESLGLAGQSSQAAPGKPGIARGASASLTSDLQDVDMADGLAFAPALKEEEAPVGGKKLDMI